MSGSSVPALVERWQTGAALVLASALGGFLAAALVGDALRPPTGSLPLVGFFAGAVATFLALSYTIYGR